MYNPGQLICVRHGQSIINAMRDERERDPEYKRFIDWYRNDPENPEIIALAQKLKRKYAHRISDYSSPITMRGELQSIETAKRLKKYVRNTTAVVLISPYLRVRQTFEQMKIGYPELANVGNVFYEDDLREQSPGVLALYGDFEIFAALNPEQRELRQLEGEYFYKFPGGESIPDLRFRVRSFLERMRKRYNNRDVLIVAHAQVLLALRAEIEHWSVEEFLKWQADTSLINCAVSIYTKLYGPLESGILRNTMFNRKLY